MPEFRPRLERRLHELFELSLLAKALLASGELLSGIGLWLIKASWILTAAQWLTQQEISEDPQDPVALWLLSLAHDVSIQTQHFWAFYLIAHGLVKLAVVGGLVMRVNWAYPASIAVLVGFIAYQVEQFWFTHSLWMVVLTVFDLVVIWLIWHEWTTQKAAGRL